MTDFKQNDLDAAIERGHESYALGARPILVAVAFLFGGVVFALVAMAGLGMLFVNQYDGDAVVGFHGIQIEPPSSVPAVNVDQLGALRRLREQEHAVLTKYSWVDRGTGIARIPIERAMEIEAQKTQSDDSDAR